MGCDLPIPFAFHFPVAYAAIEILTASIALACGAVRMLGCKFTL
jgi:hypothetical protein